MQNYHYYHPPKPKLSLVPCIKIVINFIKHINKIELLNK